MNSTSIQSTIMTLLLLFSMVCQAQKSFDDNRPDDISDDTWQGLKVAAQEAKLTAADGAASDEFGLSVSLSGDRALIGAYRDDDSGSAYVFDLVAGSWTETVKLTATDGATGDQFGFSVSLDGDRALVGAYNNDDIGSAYVFDLVSGSWSQTARLTASDKAEGEEFGFSVSLSGDRALIGAHFGEGLISPATGSAYVFDLVAGSWSETAKLIAADGRTADQFGSSVSLSDDRALVGAPLDDGIELNSGSAYIFDLVAGNWSETSKFTATDVEAGDLFGLSVSLSGDRALVGAPLDFDNGSSSGSAYVFDLVGGSWTETFKLNAAVGASNDQFGSSVSLTGDRALVGAYNNDDTGSAYVFNLMAGIWTETEKLTASDAAAFDDFGRSVSLDADRALVGASLDDDRGTNSGSAYVSFFGFQILVNVTGLAAGNSFELLINGGDNLMINKNGLANFDFSIFDGETYAVTVNNQPINPNQTCVVSNPTGTISGADVILDVTCTTIQYAVAIDVTGLAGSGLTFSNGDDILVFTTDGIQTISTLDDGSAFNVAITNQVTAPNQICSFTNANSGNLNGSNYTVSVTCETIEYSIGGTLSGLASGNFVTLSINSGDELLAINDNSTFTFLNPLFDGSVYAVSVLSQPILPNQTCVVAQAEGTLMGADVSNISITCTINQYFIGGTVLGLIPDNFMVLQNNLTDNTIITDEGPFVINTPINDQESYTTSIFSQPDNPIQSCQLFNPAGSVNGNDVTDVIIACEFGDDLIYRHGFDGPDAISRAMRESDQ